MAAAAAAAVQLDDYEAAVGRMLRHPDEEVLYAETAEQFDAIRALTAGMPGLRGRWIEVLISRFELLEEFWRVKEGQPTPGELDRLRANHIASLQSFGRLCVQRIISAGSTASG